MNHSYTWIAAATFILLVIPAGAHAGNLHDVAGTAGEVAAASDLDGLRALAASLRGDDGRGRAWLASSSSAPQQQLDGLLDALESIPKAFRDHVQAPILSAVNAFYSESQNSAADTIEAARVARWSGIQELTNRASERNVSIDPCNSQLYILQEMETDLSIAVRPCVEEANSKIWDRIWDLFNVQDEAQEYASDVLKDLRDCLSKKGLRSNSCALDLLPTLNEAENSGGDLIPKFSRQTVQLIADLLDQPQQANACVATVTEKRRDRIERSVKRIRVCLEQQLQRG